MDIERPVHGAFAFRFHVSTIAAILIALIWLPTLLRVFAVTGGAVKTPAGEATTGGLLGFVRLLTPETRERVLPTLIAATEATEAETAGAERRAAQRVREELQDEFASVAAPRTSVFEALQEAARRYERLREELPAGPDRTFEMTRLLAEVRPFAEVASPEEVVGLFETGTEGGRVVTLALIDADPDSSYFVYALDGISNSRSAFEQFHALRTMQQMLPILDERRRRQLLEALERERRNERGTDPQADSSRWALITELYRALRPSGAQRRKQQMEFERSVARLIESAGGILAESIPEYGLQPDS